VVQYFDSQRVLQILWMLAKVRLDDCHYLKTYSDYFDCLGGFMKTSLRNFVVWFVGSALGVTFLTFGGASISYLLNMEGWIAGAKHLADNPDVLQGFVAKPAPDFWAEISEFVFLHAALLFPLMLAHVYLWLIYVPAKRPVNSSLWISLALAGSVPLFYFVSLANNIPGKAEMQGMGAAIIALAVAFLGIAFRKKDAPVERS
jgi:hypothetical protein